MVIYLPMATWHLRALRNLFLCVWAFQGKLEFGNFGLLGEGKTGFPRPEKNLSEQGQNQQQTRPTYDAGSGNWTQATKGQNQVSAFDARQW